MHIYIYDTFVNQKKYERTVARIETRITDLGLNGKIIRKGLMTSVYDIIDNEIKKGASTIVAVGNNQIFSQAINAVTKSATQSLSKHITLGFIPIDKNDNSLADILGIGESEEACNILSARRIKTYDLGMVNNNYFLVSAQISTNETKLEIDENYLIEVNQAGKIEIVNLPFNQSSNKVSSAEDNKLELFIDTKKTKKIISFNGQEDGQSFISFTNLRIINPKEMLLLDFNLKVETPADVYIAKEKINLIVGKSRNF